MTCCRLRRSEESWREGGHLLSKQTTHRLDRLYSAVLCDSLDQLGYRQQGLGHLIRPLFPEARIIGAARTLSSIPKAGFPEKPYQKELEALDMVRPGDVIVFSTGGDLSAGVWGELLSVAASAKGAGGAVIDGLTRDADRIREKKFPVFACGISPYDSYGRSEVVAYDVPIQCGGVTVHSGDVVFADYDGVVIIPQAVLDSILSAAETKASRERIVEAEFQKGRKVADVFAEHGVL
jgi:4-hydroxy-4-methyl-2-oxoglutarate aldolase